MASNAPSAQVIELSATASDRDSSVVTHPSNPDWKPAARFLNRTTGPIWPTMSRCDCFLPLAGAAMVGLAVPALADPPPPSVPDNPAADATFLGLTQQSRHDL